MAKKSAAKKSAAKKTTSTKGSSNASATKSASTAKDTGKIRPLMRRAKSTSRMAILESLVIGVLGILLIMNPEGMFKVIFYVIGILLIVKGAYKTINYFAAHGKYDFYDNDLLYGVIALVFGILAIVLWEQLGKLIGIAVGAWMIYGALVRMNAAIKMHTAGVREWFYVLLLSMIMLALGIYMVISASAIPMVIGWVMIAAAVIGIIDDVLFIRHVDEVTQ